MTTPLLIAVRIRPLSLSEEAASRVYTVDAAAGDVRFATDNVDMLMLLRL